MNRYVMALDQGTTSSRCILFDRQGRTHSMAQREIKQSYPQDGWVEHDPMEIWSTQLQVARDAMKNARVSAGEIAAIGITNQRETTIVWEKGTGRPIYNAIVWQCRRTAGRIESLCREGLDRSIQEKTGLIPDAYFSGTKIPWILDHVPGARARAEAGELLFGTVDTWLLWNLTGGTCFVTDVTNASRTMLFNIHTLQWDAELLEHLRVPRCMLPEVKPSSQIYGYTEEEWFGAPIPLAGVAGDQQAALFGQCCFSSGDVKNTYGTGCFLLMNTGEKAVKSRHGLLTTIAVGLENRVEYALEGSVFVAGAGVQWLRDEMRLIDSSAETERYCMAVPDTAGVYVVPAFTGLGAPYWNPHARGMVVGLTRGAGKAHFIRATVESMAYQVADVIQAMEQDAGLCLKTLKVDGGACANNFLMQFQADLLDVPLARPLGIETSALGAAYLAGLAVGYWKNRVDIQENWALSRIFQPAMEETKRERLLQGWKRAVRSCLAWPEHKA